MRVHPAVTRFFAEVILVIVHCSESECVLWASLFCSVEHIYLLHIFSMLSLVPNTLIDPVFSSVVQQLNDFLGSNDLNDLSWQTGLGLPAGSHEGIL